MTASCLQRCGNRKKLLSIIGRDIRNHRLTDCQCSGFIKHNCINTARCFQRLSALHKDTELCRLAGSHHDCRRCCQTKRTRAGDNQHTDKNRQRKGKILCGKIPEQCCHKGNRHNRWHEIQGNLIRNTCNRSLFALCLLDHTDNFRKCGILLYRIAFHHNSGIECNRPLDQCIPLRLGNWHTFPRQHAFIHTRMSFL